MCVKTLFENSLAPFECIIGLLTFLAVSFWYLWRSWPVWNAVWRWPWQDYQQHPRGPEMVADGGQVWWFDSLLFDATFFNVKKSTWFSCGGYGWKTMPDFFHQPQQIQWFACQTCQTWKSKIFVELIDFADVFLFPHQEDSALVADIIPVSIGREMAVKVGDRLEAGRHLLEWHAFGNLYGCFQK